MYVSLRFNMHRTTISRAPPPRLGTCQKAYIPFNNQYKIVHYIVKRNLKKQKLVHV